MLELHGFGTPRLSPEQNSLSRPGDTPLEASRGRQSSGLALGRLTLCRALAWPKKMALRWEFLDGYHRCGAVGSQNGNSRL